MMGTLLTGLILFLFEVGCESEPTHAVPERVEGSNGETLVYLTPHWAFQLVNDSLSFSRADSFCRGRFSSLITSDQKEVLELLRQAGLHSSVWVRDSSRVASKPVALSQQYLQFSALKFPKESRDGFAHVNKSFPALSSVSVCVRVQWDPWWSEVSTIFSYAAPVFTNEFQLRGQADMQGRILLALIIHGKHLPYKASFPNDGAWHQICVTWQQSGGHWATYVDGDRKDTGSDTDTSRDIYGDGILILGQDQDSFGGNFTEPFFGNITDLNVWNMSLESHHVRLLNECSPVTQDLLFSWNLELLSSHPVVKEVQARLFCPAVHQQVELQGCRTLQGWSAELPQLGLTDCLDLLPFICRSSRERYLKMKQMSDSQSSQPTAFMSQLMKLSNQSQLMLPSGLSSLAQASALLDVSVQALEDTRDEGLQPADMMSLIQLLSLTADVPSQPFTHDTNYSQDNIQELSQHFISLADSIISEEDTLKWQAIKEVVHTE
ncbi:adhesion G protein-coupled receptor D2-like [Maylandia zebra]|uniref:adhesion G protein-coupled receptor D2-like n=1 Tax=Maylandia zebra TaxID=106582 RepID=UPI00403D19D7